MRTHILPVHDQSCLNGGMSSHDSEGSDPPFRRGDKGRVEIESLGRVVVRSDSFEFCSRTKDQKLCRYCEMMMIRE